MSNKKQPFVYKPPADSANTAPPRYQPPPLPPTTGGQAGILKHHPKDAKQYPPPKLPENVRVPQPGKPYPYYPERTVTQVQVRAQIKYPKVTVLISERSQILSEGSTCCHILIFNYSSISFIYNMYIFLLYIFSQFLITP